MNIGVRASRVDRGRSGHSGHQAHPTRLNAITRLTLFTQFTRFRVAPADLLTGNGTNFRIPVLYSPFSLAVVSTPSQ